jgi:protein-L-isoaspartate(D-aspartate) O-methyltransferase
MTYRQTPDADPQHVYHNVLIALDPKRELNNGHPSSLCSWIDLLRLEPGSQVYHLGCGSGYYTALMSVLVGREGHVVGAEIDPDLVAMARRSLQRFTNVSIHEGDGFAFDPGPMNAMLVNAGTTHLLPLWLERLRPGGRLLVPITFAPPGSSTSTGFMLLVSEEQGDWRARATGPVAIFASEAGRSPELNERLKVLLPQGAWRNLKRVRREAHEAATTCWLHVDGACLSL